MAEVEFGEVADLNPFTISIGSTMKYKVETKKGELAKGVLERHLKIVMPDDLVRQVGADVDVVIVNGKRFVPESW